MSEELRDGDYVLASKYADGDTGDQYAVGFYDQSFDHYGERRHLIRDSQGKQFRANGFRRVERITDEEGTWLCERINAGDIPLSTWTDLPDGEREISGSIWDWLAEARARLAQQESKGE